MRLVHVVVDPRGLGSASVPVGTLGTGRPLPGTAFASPQQGTQGALQQYAQRLTADARHMLAARAEPLLAGRPGSEVLTPLVSGARSAATIGEAVVDEAHNRGRLLVVANHGPGAKAGIGSVARYCYQRLDVPLVLVPPRSTAHNMPPTVPGHHSTQPSPSSAIMFAARSTAELAVMWTQLASACGSSLLRRSSSSNSGGGGGGDVARVLLLDGSHVPADVKAQMLAAGFSAVEECGPLAVTTGNSHAVAPPASGGVIDDHSAAVGAALLELCSSQQPGGGGASVRGQAAAVRLLVMANYARAGMLREVMDGGVAAYASCHHTLPLVLVPLPGA